MLSPTRKEPGNANLTRAALLFAEVRSRVAHVIAKLVNISAAKTIHRKPNASKFYLSGVIFLQWSWTEMLCCKLLFSFDFTLSENLCCCHTNYNHLLLLSFSAIYF